ncbi:MAG: type 1 glutamine amidotransferase [Acidimicrobiia bacterium]
MTESYVRIGLVYPELLGTYGDRGNAVVLVERCRRRGIAAELVEVAADEPLPDSLDLYLFGGGEDDPQSLASERMRASAGALERARADGAVVLAVCAGFQLIGASYETGDGEMLDGLGLVDMRTVGATPRLIGEVVVEPDPSTGLPPLTGFENHSGRTTLGAGVQPLGRVSVGGGNGVGGVDGARADRLVGTYLHGPVLPRNAALADFLLAWIVGADALTPIDDHLTDALHTERLAAATATGWRARLRDLRTNRG